METAYCLAPDFEFVDPSKLTNPNFDAGLLNKSTGAVLLLNAELTALLTLFREPSSVSDAASHFANQLKAPLSDVRPIIQMSVNTYVQEGILVTTEVLRQKSEYPFPTLAPGTTLKDYVVLKSLTDSPPVGIYLVKNQAGKRYILKKLFIHPQLPRNLIRGQKKEFAYEFQVLGQLKDCPLVNQLTEFDPNDNIGVIEYFTGVSLRRYVTNNHTTLSVEDRISLFRQLLQGIDCLHNRGVLHGDLHTSNVLVNKRNQIRLIDFDLAFLWRDRKKKGIRYGGVTDFIPPERLTDDVFAQSTGLPTFRGEVYQTGILGYFIFQGKLPFGGKTWREQVDAIRHAAPQWDAPVPDAIRIVLEKALQKEPAQRFASATLMQAGIAA